MRLAAAPLPDGFRIGPKADHQRVSPQGFHVGGIRHQAATGGNDQLLPLGQTGHHVAFHPAKFLLPRLAENLRNGHPCLIFNQCIGVHELKVQIPRHLPADRRLARAHEPHESQIPYVARRVHRNCIAQRAGEGTRFVEFACLRDTAPTIISPWRAPSRQGKLSSAALACRRA